MPKNFWLGTYHYNETLIFDKLSGAQRFREKTMQQLETIKQVMSAPILELPPSGQQPTGNLAPRDTEHLAEALVAYHGAYADVYKRREQRDWAEC